jgi:hypothetical protein
MPRPKAKLIDQQLVARKGASIGSVHRGYSKSPRSFGVDMTFFSYGANSKKPEVDSLRF